MARPSNLEKMSYSELAKMATEVARLKAEKQVAERVSVRQQIIDLARQHGYDVAELFGKSRQGKGSVAPKYRDPKNPANTWTGRGRMPRWMVAATKGAKASKEDFLIK